MSVIDDLYRSISERWMPEDVVRVLVDAGVCARQSVVGRAYPRWARSSMAKTFAKADGLAKQLLVAEALFKAAAPAAHDPAAVLNYLELLGELLHVSSRERLDFKADRLARDERKIVPDLPAGHRAYNKRFRLLRRMSDKYARWIAVANLRDLAQIAKSRLATRIAREDFVRDQDTAAFVAYLVARLNKRSIFTFGKQERAFDEIADHLFQKLGEGTSWFVVAHVYPEASVLARLTDDERGRLLGAWYAVMVRAAKVLLAQAEKDQPDLVRLIVRRGNDSSTWNEAAGAFNKARDGWIAMLHALGGEALLDRFAPGKALRLMAADVAWGHSRFGDGLEPDTAVWGALPKPWEVVLDGVRCDRGMIEEACVKFGPIGKGWIAPRPKTIAEFHPTPELVHGVVCASSELAAALKRLGYFGGPSKAAEAREASVSISRAMDGRTPTVDWGG